MAAEYRVAVLISSRSAWALFNTRKITTRSFRSSPTRAPVTGPVRCNLMLKAGNFSSVRATQTAAPKTTDYYYNSRLAQTKWQTNDAPSFTIAAGEGTGDSSTSYHLSQLPKLWRTDESAPAWRHSGDANYLFTDGHAKWFAPEKITLDKPSKNNPTFLVK